MAIDEGSAENSGAEQALALSQPSADVPRVVRSGVPEGKGYSEYRNYLRYDFFYSCAYCLLSEAEGAAIRFTIDHYEAQKHRPDLAHEYSNLMYSCGKCNEFKGDRYPSEEMRSEGYRFFRIDQDVFADHFELSDLLLKHKTNTGYYTIEACDLNRLALRRLREIRRRMERCDELVAEGLLAMKRLRLDRMPREVRGRVFNAIKQANGVVSDVVGAIDMALRENMKSPLIDDDPDAEKRARERSASLKGISVLVPGNLRSGGSK